MSDNKKNVKDTNGVVGTVFEDMDIAQMTEVQGAGDMDSETFIASAAALSAAVSAAAGSIQIVQTIKAKC